ncbi:MAG: hyuA [Solirubrobacterales bacterium]|nr:hyuA [Solirubrobacterales bacterium]
MSDRSNGHQTPEGWRLAVDIGGTFTDVVLAGPGAREVVTTKTLTTRDPLDGVRTGVIDVMQRAGLPPAGLTEPIVHATTLVTNALIEGTGAPVAFVTTAGFEDVFEIRTEHRYDMYDIQIEFAPPPVPRERILGIAERTVAGGAILARPAPEDIARLGREISAMGVAAVAVGFLHSYANGENEEIVAAALREATGLPVCTSSDVAGLVREYPRFVTAAANAQTVPILGPYLARLEGWLASQGIPASVLLMLSNGGAVGARVAGRYPIRAIESGPAAGALAGAWLARRHAPERLLCFDMGGTTAKACILENSEPQLGTSFEYARQYRFIAGSGLPLSTPSVDLIEIGAGGGSLAHRDDFGLLAVGPQSAGSEPGPACYARGGTQPTVTDAALLLGYLDAPSFAGGKMPLDVDAAERAAASLADELGIAAHDVAAGIHELANQSMAAAAARYATERGVDLRGVPLLAFGGAGPVHACGVAELLDATEIVFPPMASVLSAFGCLVSPLRIDLARSRLTSLADAPPDAIEEICEEMRKEGRDLLVESGLPADVIAFRYGIDARYRGQANEVTIWLGEGAAFPATAGEALLVFEARYEELYGMTIPDVPVEVVTWRIAAVGPEPAIDSRPLVATRHSGAARTRAAWFGRPGAWMDTTVVSRESLSPGDIVEGPAVVEERDTTVVLRPDWTATVAEDLSLVAVRRLANDSTPQVLQEAISHDH